MLYKAMMTWRLFINSKVKVLRAYCIRSLSVELNKRVVFCVTNPARDPVGFLDDLDIDEFDRRSGVRCFTAHLCLAEGNDVFDNVRDFRVLLLRITP